MIGEIMQCYVHLKENKPHDQNLQWWHLANQEQYVTDDQAMIEEDIASFTPPKLSAWVFKPYRHWTSADKREFMPAKIWSENLDENTPIVLLSPQFQLCVLSPLPHAYMTVLRRGRNQDFHSCFATHFCTKLLGQANDGL